ncbi:uncharacterized protein LOC128243313 [Mya arenaria]|uniref:uncharacterized protein LOC128243313 n=1 Tax=Mya arenaria TaxID=6604 RepID=UPI0022E78398|nr:uncharacterized protein LOC128243313 [Mya arenaria]
MKVVTVLLTFVAFAKCNQDFEKVENKEVGDIKKALLSLTDEVKQLRNREKYQNGRVSELESRLNEERAARSNLEDQVQQMEKRLETCVKYSDTSLAKRALENEYTVAFYGKINDLAQVQQGDILQFNNVITDIGHAYDTSTGLFTAPTAGLYVFGTTIMIEQHLDTHLGIYVNNQKMTNIKMFGTEHMYDTMTQMAVYYLRRGDRVSIRHDEGNKTIHPDYSTFTAFLLNQEFGQIKPNPITVG